MFCQDIFEENGEIIYFFEGQYSENASISTGEIRAVEALRNTNVNICVIDFEEKILMQNRSDLETFEKGPFQDRFVNSEDYYVMLGSLQGDPKFSSQVKLRTRAGESHFSLFSSLGTDPITGLSSIVVNLTDISRIIEAEKAIEAHRHKVAMATLKAKEAAMAKDLELARAVQDLFLPKVSSYTRGNWSISGKIISASECSGDWWSYVEKENSSLVFAADVTGHGAHSAMLSSAIASSVKIRTEVQFESLKSLIAKVNNDVYSICQNQYFSTMTVLEIDHSTDSLRIHFNGSPEVLVIRENGSILSYGATSSLIGVQSELLSTQTIDIQPEAGDLVLMLSDGLLEEEIPGNNRWGYRRLEAVFSSAKGMSSQGALESILKQFREITEKDFYSDDVTLVVLRKEK